MADPRDKLADALAHIRLMRFPLQFVRSERTQERLTRAVDAVEQEIREALASLERHPGYTPTREDPVRRRDLLRYSATMSMATMFPVTRPARVDAGLLDALHTTTASYAHGYYQVPPGDLLLAARAHVNRLVALLSEGTMTPGLRDRLGALTSDTAALAGHLASDADRKGEARAFYTLARDTAREAGDATLYSLAVASLGILLSPSTGGNDAGAAAWHTSQAIGTLPPQAPDYVRAWLHAQHSKDLAAKGERDPFHAAMEHVDVALGRGQMTEAPGVFWGDAGWFAYLGLHGWRQDYLGRGLAYLGHDDAGDVIRPLLEQAEDRRQRARLHLSLAEWHLRREEPTEAAATARAALGATPHWDGRVRALRGRLEPWHELTAVRDLDEALALTR